MRQNGEDVPSPATQQPPPGWAWKTQEWETDTNRACDAEGLLHHSLYIHEGEVYLLSFHLFSLHLYERWRILVDVQMEGSPVLFPLFVAHSVTERQPEELTRNDVFITPSLERYLVGRATH